MSIHALGRHILVEFIGCSPDVMNDVSVIEKSMIDAAQDAGATVINSTFHHFSPFGVSGVVVIQESHLAIHTWPEYQYAAVDLFTCGASVDAWRSFDILRKAFGAQNYSVLEMYRGSLSLLKRVNFTPEASRVEHEKMMNPAFRRDLWFTDKDENQAFSLRYSGDLLFNEKSPYQTVRVFNTHAYGKMLSIGNMVMCTERDEFHYHEMITHPALQLHGKPQNILVIGGGDGGTIREAFRYPTIDKITMVEIDETVTRAAKLHLPTIASQFSHPKLDLRFEDGIAFVAKAKAESFDAIIVDGSDPVGPAKGLFTETFYKDCYKALKPNGILATQGESPMFHEQTFIELNQCLKRVFSKDKVHTQLFYASSYPTGMWSVQLGMKGNLHPLKDFQADTCASFAKEHKLRYYNEDIHRAAFALPSFVKKLLAEDKR